MSSNEPFGPWAEAMEKAGVGDPRNGRPSWTQLAARARVSVSAVTNMVNGKTAAKPATVQKVANALGVRPEDVSQWLGAPRPVRGPYVPAAESALLSDSEREALDNLIRAIARGRTEESDGRGDATPNTPGPDGPAPDNVRTLRPDTPQEPPARAAARKRPKDRRPEE